MVGIFPTRIQSVARVGLLHRGKDYSVAYSTSFSSFSDLENEVTGGPWNLMLDPNGSPDSYVYAVTMTGIYESTFGSVVVTQPNSTTVDASQTTTYSWTGPAGFDHIDFIIQRQDWSVQTYVTLADDATDYTLAAPLDAGLYRLAVRYVAPFVPGNLEVGEPQDSSQFASTGIQWQPTAGSIWSIASREFTVVPEPSCLGLLGFAGFGLLRCRR